jgi:hypothetical protein
VASSAKFTERLVRVLGHPWTVFWSLHAAYWTVAWISLSLLVRILRPAMVAPERSVAIHVITAFMATALLPWLLGKRRFIRQLGLSPAGVVMGGAILIAVVQTLVEDRIFALGIGDGPGSRPRTIALFIVRLAALLGWAFSYIILRLIEEHRLATARAAEARAEAGRSELRFLQAQMDPHFLFNALNAVLACKDDPEAVETVTQSLAEYLRFCLRETAPLEPLSRELDALGTYLTVHEIRFGDDLHCTIDCERQAGDVMVPPMLVQPLLENALKYGAATSPMPLHVAVTARLDRDRLEVEVANTGKWMPPDPARSGGIGMRSLEKRLVYAFGEAATIHIDDRDGWVRVVVRLPAKAHRHDLRPRLEEATT